MFVISLLFSAVVMGLAKLFASGSAGTYVGRLVLYFAIGWLLFGGLGILMGTYGQPRAGLEGTARQVIGEVIFRAEAAIGSSSDASLQEIEIGIVPDSIFLALSSGNMLSILFFALPFGVSLGSIEKTKSNHAIAFFESLYETMMTIIGWLIYSLPFGLFCLCFSQVSPVGLPILGAMIKLVVLIYAGCILAVLASVLLTWMRIGGSIRRLISALRETTFVAFGTSSGFAALPAALSGMRGDLGVDQDVVDLVMPLGITLNPPASAVYFAISTVFLAHLYGVELDISQLAFVLLGSILAGLVAAGAPGMAAVSMISLILVPLGLPVEVAITLLVAIDPIIDPPLTVANMHVNSAKTILLADRPQGEMDALAQMRLRPP